MKRYLIYLAIILWLIMSLFNGLSLFQSIENRVYDYGFLKRPPIKVSNDIVTIDIDDPAINTIGRWPWDWTVHRILFEHLHNHKIKNLFVIDMDFPERSEISLSPAEEELLKKVIKKGSKREINEIITQRSPERFFHQLKAMNEYVYFSVFTTLHKVNAKGLDKGDVKEYLQRESLSYDNKAPSFPYATSIVLPIKEIQYQSKGLGINAISPDSDGVVRRYPLFVDYKGNLIPSIAIKAVKAITNTERVEFQKNTISLVSSDKRIIIPVNSNGEMTINWSGRYASSFVHIPFNLLANYILVDILKDSLRGINLGQLPNPMLIHDTLTEEAISKSLVQKDVATVKATILFLSFLMDYYFANSDITPEEILPALGLDINNKDILALARQIYINNLAIKRYLISKDLLPFDEFIKGIKININDDEATTLRDSYEQMRFYIEDIVNIDNIRPLYFEPSKRLIIEGREYKINPTFLRDKNVFYGLTATGLTSQNPTPFMDRHPMLDLVPQVVNTIITGSFLRESPPWITYLLFALYISIVLVSAFKFRPIIGLLITALFASIHAVITWYLFISHGWKLPVSSPLLALFISYVSAIFLRYYDEYKERTRVKKIFSTMVSPEVLKIMVQRRDSIALAGEIKEATVFSSDVSGFTTISEGVTAQELAKILNVYLSAMSNIIMSFDGYIDKYEGDAIKAVFGVPLADENHHFKACYSALLQQQELKIIQRMILIKYGVKITARMGINSGLLYAGNMGSQKRVQYTVMGETVKIAEELEPANKLFDTWICAGEETVKRAGKYIKSRYLGDVHISDTLSVKAYEVIGWDKDMYISYWGSRPIPELLLESFMKISPERILASISYYKGLHVTDSKLLKDLIGFFDELRSYALEMLKIEGYLNILEIQQQVYKLKKAFLNENANQEDSNDLIKRLKDDLLILEKTIETIVLDDGQKEQLIIQIDTIKKSIECLHKRLNIDCSDDDNLRELVDYLRDLSIGSVRLDENNGKELRERYNRLDEKIRARTLGFTALLKNRGNEFHQLIANLCESP